MQVRFRELRAEDIAAIVATTGGAAWNGGSKKWDSRWDEHARGSRLVLLAEAESGIVAYGSLAWASQYPSFHSAGIPEIQDLVVAEHYRGNGIGTRLIHALEDRARAAGHLQVGIGVGLYRDYGSAQRLYSALGYAPDGRGITYKNEPAVPGGPVRVDDDLVLWLVKDLPEAASTR